MASRLAHAESDWLGFPPPVPMSTPALISALARSLMAAEPTAAGALARARRTLGQPWRWLHPLSVRYAAEFGGRTRPRHRDVVRFLREDPGLRRALIAHRDRIVVAEWLTESNEMQPA